MHVPDLEECFRASLASPHLDVSLDELREKGFLRAKPRQRACEGLQFKHSDGKYRFPEALSPEPQATPDFPLQLLTLIRRDAIHSQVIPEDHPPVCPHSLAPIIPCCAKFDWIVTCFSSHLWEEFLSRWKKARYSPLVVIYRRGDWMHYGGGANQLIKSKITDLGEGAAFYSQHVRLEN